MINPIQSLMEEYDLTRVQFVDLLRHKVSQGSIYGWIDGSHVPTSGNINLILDQFDMDKTARQHWKFQFNKWRFYKRENS